MGFYLRKSIEVGPLRFNLSKSGVGVSTGIRGLRVGTGPRGNYVHMGVGGIYYRTTLPTGSRSSGGASPQPQPQFARDGSPIIPSDSIGPMIEIESADVSQIVDSSSTELLQEIQQKNAKFRLLPTTLIIAAAALFLSWGSLPSWGIGLLASVLGALCYYVHIRDTLAKTVVLFYELDEQMEKAYERLHDAAAHVATAKRVWHIKAVGNVKDGRYHAGAGKLNDRAGTTFGPKAPPFLETNVETYALNVGRQTLYFFPDRVLVFDSGSVGAVGYDQLGIDISPVRFIEEEGVPSDSEVVGRTWRYVNKNGAPDRRFKDNKELPICRYDAMTFSSQTGLEEMIHLSRAGVADLLDTSIKNLARKMPAEGLGVISRA